MVPSSFHRFREERDATVAMLFAIAEAITSKSISDSGSPPQILAHIDAAPTAARLRA